MLAFPDASITAAQVVPAGGGGAKDLPAFCRVAATLKPSTDSDIKIEVWLPAAGWNGKFQAVGNGGWNGNIDRNALAAGAAARLRRRQHRHRPRRRRRPVDAAARRS